MPNVVNLDHSIHETNKVNNRESSMKTTTNSRIPDSNILNQNIYDHWLNRTLVVDRLMPLSIDFHMQFRPRWLKKRQDDYELFRQGSQSDWKTEEHFIFIDSSPLELWSQSLAQTMTFRALIDTPWNFVRGCDFIIKLIPIEIEALSSLLKNGSSQYLYHLLR